MIFLLKITLFFVSGLLLVELFMKKEPLLIKGFLALLSAVFIIPNIALAVGFALHTTVSLKMICAITACEAIAVYIAERLSADS